ncbi:MAG TPA: FAD-dependent oxidoreductase [Longimicrobiales bacterium]|jgi:glycine/D-amino acid oxidase-like deaminating enzyme
MPARASTAIVVGGGVFGLAAALELRRRRWSVRLVEAEPIPGSQGASADVSKLVRMDYGSDGFMTALAELAIAGWDAWNARWRRPLFHKDGILFLSESPLVPGGFEHDSRATVLGRAHVIQDVDAALLEERFPAWNARRFGHGYLNPTAGWVESGEVVRLLASDAHRAGVKVIRARVRALNEGPRGRPGIVTEDGAVHRADALVVAGGAWTPELVPSLGAVMTPVGQPVLHFRVAEPEAWRAPAFLPWAADIARTGWYGFPALADGTVKVGHHGSGLGPPAAQGLDIPAAHVDRCRAFLAEALPALAGAPLAACRVCPYCDTFDGDFWIARDPSRPAVTVASGGSGHGFKFAPILGPLIADAVEGRRNRWGERFGWRAPGTKRWEDARLT